MIFGQTWLFLGKGLYSGKSCCFGAKEVLFRQSSSILAEVVDSVESDYIRAKVVVFGQKWLY